MSPRQRLTLALATSLCGYALASCGDDDQRVIVVETFDVAETRDTIFTPDTVDTADTTAPELDVGETVADSEVEAVETVVPDTRDTTEPDTRDTTEADTQPDTTVPDTAPFDTEPDTAPVDTEPDTIPVDTEPADTTPVEVVDAPPGTLAYTRVDNIAVVDDLMHIAWHPSGDYALVSGRGGILALYHPGAPIDPIGTLGSDIVDLVALSEDNDPEVGQFAVLDATLGLVRIAVDAAAGTFETIATTALPVGSGRALAPEPGTDRIAIAAHGSDSIAYLYLWTPAGLSPVKGFNAGAGIADLMWGAPSLYAGSANLITAHGHNGADSKTWVLASDLVIANNWSGGFGNAGGSAWRPGGTYGAVCGWSSNKLYVFDGAWTNATLPVPTGASPNAIAWKVDGSRALIVGRVIGSPAYAVVVEHRPTGSAFQSSFVDQSIRNFADAPWFGNTSSMHLLDVAWRPGTGCDEGLIVGTDSGASFSPTFGTAIAFHDDDDPACQAKP